MFGVPSIVVVLIAVSFFSGATLSQKCESNSYLPKGLACKLDIFIRSEGQSDTNLSASSGSSFLIVNGEDYSRKSRGINLAVFDHMSGLYMSGGVFDVKASSAEGTKLRDFIQNLPNDVIIVMAVQGTGNANSNLNTAVSVMRDVGVNETAILDKESFAAVAYKGSGSPSWIKDSKNTVGNGPSFVTVSIPVPYGYIPDEALRTPFSNVAGSMFGGYCINSSTNSDANTVCNKALDGSAASEWVSKSEGIGAWISIGFASSYKINKVRILQRTLSAAQTKDVKIEFSDCSTVAASLTRDKGDFEEFTFSPRITSWVKLTVTSTYTSSSNGFKEIQFYYDQYESDTACDQVNVTTGSTSNAYRLLKSSIALQILSQKPVIMLSTTASSSGPRYEITLDDPNNSNTTYIKRSHDGSPANQVAVSVARQRVISESTSVHVWLDWKEGRIVVGMGEKVILYFRDQQPLTVKYMFLQSPTSNAVFKLCGRKDYLYRSASSYWPMDKVIGGSLIDLNGSNRGTLHGPYETTNAQGKTAGFDFVATKFDGTSNWADLGDYKDTCVSDIDLCDDGLTVLLRIDQQKLGTAFMVSSGGQHTRGFAIYSPNSTTLRVELRDSEQRWLVDRIHATLGHLMIGFTWSRDLGLTVLTGSASISVKTNNIGEMLSTPVDESTHLILGGPNNEKAKYFQGSINSLVIFEYSMSSDSLAAFLQGSEMSGFTDSCYKDNSFSPSSLYYPGDIDPEVLSPSVCREQCGNTYYTKAVIFDGTVCTCVNETSSFASVANDLCIVPCTGHANQKCGGIDGYVHVLDAVKTPTSLVCTMPAKQEALTQFSVTIQLSKPFYNLKETYLEVGDGSLNEKQSSPFDHAFVAVANFTTSPKAALQHNETGQRRIIECPNQVESYLPLKGVSFTCPAYVPTNKEFKCDISFVQGNDIDVQVTWSGSLANKLALPDSRVVNIGPEYTERSPPAIQTSPGMYLFSDTVDRHKGTFVGFQMDVVSGGYLEIKCLSVVCDDPSQRFCPSQSACISQQSTCEPRKMTCSSGSTLSMSSGSCSSGISGSIHLPNVSSSNFNYKMLSSYILFVNSGQRNLVPLNNTVDTSRCDFFGLFTSSDPTAAVIAMSPAPQSTLFYSLSAVSAASANNDIMVGLHSPQRANGPQVVDNVPNFQYKVIPNGNVTALHTYTEAGTYEAKAKLGEHSFTNRIHAQDVVSNISLSAAVPAHPTHKASNMSLNPQTGTNVTYTWIFNSTNVTTSTPWLMYTCDRSGIHSVAIFSRNKVSVSYSQCSFECQDEISGLEFTVNGLQTSAEKEPARISWSLKNGSSVFFKVDPGDGSGVRELNDSKVSGAIFVGTLNVTYGTAGVYEVTITAFNKLGNVTTRGWITILEKIANVTMNPPACMATNQSVNISASTQHGNMMKYAWTINNQTFKTDDQSWLIYSPSTAGIYNLTLVVYNNVSTGLCSCRYIQVKDTVKGVEIGPVQPAGVRQPLSIPFKVNQGNDFRISICYGDGVCINKNGTENAVYNGTLTHSYTKDGDYVANLTICNCVGCNSTTINVHVETPVSGPKMIVSETGRPNSQDDACSGLLYVQVNKTVFMVLNVANGTNVKVLWDYGDGSNFSQSSLGPFDKNGMHSNHSYKKAGNYTITAKPYNLNGHESFTCHIVAQRPIIGLAVTSDSPQGYPDGLVTLEAVPTDLRPTGQIKCDATYGDAKSSLKLPMPFNTQKLTFKHNYPSRGKFKGSVNCSNEVSWFMQTYEVEIQDKVHGCSIKSYGTVPQIESSLFKGDGYKGPGKQGKIFQRDTNILFQTSYVNGSNLTCSFCFDCNGTGKVIKNSSCDNITHRFTTSGEKQVKVDVKNDVSVESATVQVIIDNKIDCGELTNDGPKSVGERHTITADPKSDAPCCLLSYGDSSQNKSYFVPENSSCSSPSEFTEIFEAGNIIRKQHLYKTKGEYVVSLECYDRVSKCKVQTKAVLTQIPCKQPVVKIMDCSSNSTAPTKYTRSVEIVLRTNNKIECEAPIKRTLKWEVSLNTPSSSQILNLTGLTDTSREFITISPRTLQSGSYSVCFTLNMTELIGVHGTDSCHVKIVPSPIIAEIVGGSEVSVGSNQTRTLDGTNSRDPDTDRLTAENDPKLKCYWFCKRKGDNYTLPTSIDPHNLPAVPKTRERPANDSHNTTDLGGCFGEGPGRLNTSKCERDVFTGKMRENTTYDFRLCVVHDDGRTKCTDQRWNVQKGDPPAMAIKCHINCERLTPSIKFSSSCYCLSCTSANKVEYDWEISHKKPDESSYVKIRSEKVTEMISTPKGARSITIKPDTLTGGVLYRITCKGSLEGRQATGVANYDKVANAKPSNGTCDVTPKTGIALNTTFVIRCKGWHDNDGPLLYTFGTAKDCQSEMVILASDRGNATYQVQSMLPGSAEHNYTTYVVVHVSDKYKAVNTSTCVPLQVREKKLDATNLGNILNGTVENLVALGSNNEANQVVNSVLSQVNKNSGFSSSSGDGSGGGNEAATKSSAELDKERKERTKIRSQVIGIMKKVADTVTNLKDVTQSTKTLQQAVSEPKELTPEAKTQAVGIFEGMTKAIDSKSENAEPQEVEQAVKAVYEGISNCVDFVADSTTQEEQPTAAGVTQSGSNANSGQQQQQKPKEMSEEEKNMGRKIASSIYRTLESIATLVQNTKRPGEKATVLKTKTMEIEIARERSKDLKNKNFTMSGFSMQTIPEMFPEEDSGGGPEPPAIDSTVLSASKNIYNYGDMAYRVEGGQVATIEFKNSTNHEELIFQDLSKPFEMFVDRVSRPERPTTRNLTAKSIRFLSTNVSFNDTALHVHIYPDNCDYGFDVYIKRGSFPTELSFDYNYSLPRNGEWDFESNCSSSSNRSKAFEIFLSNKDLNFTAAGRYYIGIKLKARNGTDLPKLPVNYTYTLYTSSCMYWDAKNETWKSDGCVVGNKTTPMRVQCLCTHLTSFSSSFVVPPNKIDWNLVKNFDISRGYVCLSAVLVVIALYVICLIPARRADRRDAEKTGVSPLPDNDPRDSYCYEIHVHTGFMRGAGTSAEISIVMNGSVGESDPRVLKDPARKTFRTGGVDAFLMTAPQSLGSIKSIRIWHNNGGGYPSWNLLRVMIQDLQTEQRFWFVCDKWLAVDEDDGKIERILYPATSNELTKFNVLFATEVRKNLTDGHLWFSVVTRPARSTFTRVQRLTCCLSILLCTMLANIMFYNVDASQGPKGSIKIAGFSFSLAQVSIGVISSLIVFPSNLIVVQLFRKARAKDTKIELPSSEEFTAKEIDIEKGEEKEKPKKEGLPHWFVYVAYFLALGSSIVSGTFVIFYGVTFGSEKSAQWLMSMTISFVQDVLISQPIKVFLVASIFALLIKDPNKAESDPLTDANKLSTDEEWLHKNVKDLKDDEKENFKKLITDRPPDEAKLEIARQLRMKEKHMKSIIRELVWYMFFLLIVLTVSYGNRDPATYHITKYVNDVFLHTQYSGNTSFEKVSKIDDYWKWLNETVVPSIYKDKWYDSNRDYPLGYLADTPTDLVLAVIRLRQLRIKKDSCSYLPIFQHAIPECNNFYSSEDEDRRDWLEGWQEPSNNMTGLFKQSAKRTPWEYQTGEELKTFPYWGYKATYEAGGYVKELPTNQIANGPTAHAVVDRLKNLNWLDRYTRAIFTELSIYNANINFFCVITLLYEQLPTGGLFSYPSILSLKLYRYVGGDMYFVLGCEIVYLMFTLYFIFRELRVVKKEGIGHFKNPWSVVEVFVTMLSLAMVVLYFVRMKFTSDSVAAMRKDHSAFVSFHYTAFLDEWISAIMGLIVFLSFLKIIRLLRFNRRMSLLAQTLKVCFPRIFAFLVIYGMAFFAYSQFACLVFGQSMEGFGTILRSAATLMDTILGKFALKEITDANRLIGPTFFYIYTVTMVFILINMFLSIINDSFSEVKSDVNKQSNEYEIVNFMVHRLKENIGKTMGNAIMPVYKEPKSKLEKDVDTIEEHADSIMHYMRNMTFENMRHTRWFDAETSKEKKKKMFKILLEVDWDYFEDELGDSIPVFEEFLIKYDEERLDDVYQTYRYKKMREQEMESKFTTRDSDLEEEAEESSDESNSEDLSSQSDNDDDNQNPTQYNLLHAQNNLSQQSMIPSPAVSIRSMYSPSSARQTPIKLLSNKPARSPAPSVEFGKAQTLAPIVPQVSESEMSDILYDVERNRCATDAELNSLLPEVKSLDDNNIPKYDSDPEQMAKKSKKKKKSKRPKSPVSIKSKAAWGEPDELSRKSPSGSSDKDRIAPDGAEKDNSKDLGNDNKGFEEDNPPSTKKDRKKKKKKKKENRLALDDGLEDESMD